MFFYYPSFFDKNLRVDLDALLYFDYIIQVVLCLLLFEMV
jgi:hypothetical protein